MSYKDDEWNPPAEADVDFGTEIAFADDSDDDLDDGAFVPGIADDGDEDDSMSEEY
jgi:hypothetical protein